LPFVRLTNRGSWRNASNTIEGALMAILLRLDSISPNLAGAYREANDDQRRRAALATCSAAVAQVGLQGSEVDAALAVLRHERTSRSDIRQKLDHLAAQLDKEYFKLGEEAKTITPEALLTFRKARAAAALAFALSPDPGQLHEAVYEAIAASGNQAEAARVAETALRAR
jgi:hypothetical protein